MEKLTDKQKAVLKRIQDSIPKEWLCNATTEQETYPALKEIIDKALADPETSKELRDKCLMIKNSGHLDRKSTIENPKFTKLIDQYVQREIKKAIKRGELPKIKKQKNAKNNI